ncbi:MAG: hypothetical protein ACHQ1D_13425 [Nitrososphaerales archaeon]|jgi:hypothetical protein
MTLIDFGDFKIRFDPKEVRINIDGEIIDIGARRDVTTNETPQLQDHKFYYIDGSSVSGKRIKELISDLKSP